MMNTIFGNGVTWGWHIHLIFGGALLLGGILLIILAAKFMSKKEVVTWGTSLIVLGIIGALLTGGWGFSGWTQIMESHNGCGSMMGNMMNTNSVNWESMAKDMKDADFSGLGSEDEWRDYMLEEMQEHHK